MNIAIAGCGTMGKIYADHISGMNDVNLTAVYHYDEDKSQAFARKYHCQAFTDYRTMLENAVIDAVLITLPTHLHLPYTIEAARYGKHIFCEKPAALRADEAREMFRFCREHHVRLFVAHVLRFFPEYVRIKQQVQDRAWGDIDVIHTKRFNIYPPAGSWFLDQSKSGGVVLDLMIHDIDYLIWLMGDVRSVYATGKKSGSMEYISATLRFNNDVIANMESCWGYPGGFTTQIEVIMEKGLIRHQNKTFQADQIETCSKHQGPAEGVEVPETNDAAKVDPYFMQLRHFVSCVKESAPFIVKEDEVFRALRISEMINKSLVTGRCYEWGS